MSSRTNEPASALKFPQGEPHTVNPVGEKVHGFGSEVRTRGGLGVSSCNLGPLPKSDKTLSIIEKNWQSEAAIQCESVPYCPVRAI